MAKFLSINLLGTTPVAVAKQVTPKAQPKAIGKKLYYAFAFALLTIAITIAGYLYLSGREPKSTRVDVVKVEHVKPRPSEQIHTPREARPVQHLGLKEVPWLGAIAPLLRSLISARGNIYSITTGPEGVIIFSGTVPGESINKDSLGQLLPDANIDKIKILSMKPVKEGIAYVASAELRVAKQLDFDPVSVPPYERGIIYKQIDSLAKAAGLKNVKTEIVGTEEIKGGSRFLISLRAEGDLPTITNFVKCVEEIRKMVEISRFTIEGIYGKPLSEGSLKAGFIVRAYYLPALFQQFAQSQSPTDAAGKVDSISR